MAFQYQAFRLTLVGVLISSGILAQGPVPQGGNIVPNPSFERYVAPPVGWTYRGADFAQICKYWFSATTASPDMYGPSVKVPWDWSEKGFGDQKPRTGNSMSGLTLWGCTNGKPHCREYLEIQLAEPLVTGQNYYVEFWAAPLEKSVWINKLGAYFSIGEIRRTTDEILIRKPQIQAQKILAPVHSGAWIKVSGYFSAKYEAEHLIIGNFNDDDSTATKVPRTDAYNYAYYYIDDVLVKKVPPFKTVPVKPDDLTKVALIPGKHIQLKNIYFEFDRDELMPRSYVELFKLLGLMRQYPKMSIEIIGHTDSVGEDVYNMDLSKRRAEAVVKYLVDNKVATGRVKARGAGEKSPIASNDTDEGRRLNRRVEFVVLRQ